MGLFDWLKGNKSSDNVDKNSKVVTKSQKQVEKTNSVFVNENIQPSDDFYLFAKKYIEKLPNLKFHKNYQPFFKNQNMALLRHSFENTIFAFCYLEDGKVKGEVYELTDVLFTSGRLVVFNDKKTETMHTYQYVNNEIIVKEEKYSCFECAIKYDFSRMNFTNTISIQIDEDKQLVKIAEYYKNEMLEITFDKILEVKVLENNVEIERYSRTKQAVGAIVGGALMGGAGAVVGGLTTGKQSSNILTNLSIELFIDDFKNPYREIVFFENDNKFIEIKSSSDEAIKARQNLERFYKLLYLVVRRNSR